MADGVATLRLHDGMIIAATNPAAGRNTLPQLSPDAERAELQRIVADLLLMPCASAEFKATLEAQSRGIAVDPRHILAEIAMKKNAAKSAVEKDKDLKRSVVRRSRSHSQEKADTSYAYGPVSDEEQPFKRRR
jgi:hypothetical protein